MATPKELKEEGNQAYRDGDYDKAIDRYTEALKLSPDKKDHPVYFKNRAAVYLKIDDFDNCIKDCTDCLELSPKDPKALFRRAQAYEGKEMFEKAYADARALQIVDAKNKEVQMMLERLHKIIQDKLEETTKTSGKVDQLLEILFDPSFEAEKRETSANNLVALARERAGAELLIKNGIIGRVVTMLKNEKNPEVRLGCTRAFAEFSRDMNRAKMILTEAGIPWLLELMNTKYEPQVNATQYVLQTIFNSLAGMDIMKGKKAENFLLAENKKEIDSLMVVMMTNITKSTITGLCRDAMIELVLKNVEYDRLNWGEKLLRMDGVEKLLDVASELQEFNYESSIQITNNTRMTTAICLSKVYDSMFNDKDRDRFTARIDEYLRLRLLTPDVESKVRIAVVITALLLGPLDVGNKFISREGILEMFLVMANTEEILQQKVACEALIAAASKKDKCKAILAQGIDILKKLYNSKNDAIRVRALVGMCKLGSMGGTDASMRPFSDGAAAKLTEACRRFLVNPSKDTEMRRWACEGMSYLTLDAEIKETIVGDTNALRSMIELAKSGDMNCLYGVVATFVNLVNAYDEQESNPEMEELAKFAKHHIPEKHDLDDPDFVDKRSRILVEEGAAAALVALSKTDSENSRELIARLFNAFCQQQENRGLVVQQGGTKALLGLSAHCTEKGKRCAAQALARIAITINPEVSFPGQRAYEVVRPLLKLLHFDYTGLENFEALMGLTNIAGMSESARKRIIKEKGLPMIEHYMFEYHDMIRRAAIQCMANLCSSPDVVKILEGKNDKFKYLLLCTSDEDPEIIKACAGALCMVMSESQICIKKVFDAKDWEEILEFLLSHKDPEIQYRGTVIVYLLICLDKYTAERIIDTHCKTALTAIAKIDHPELVLPKARQYAIDCLNMCSQEWKLIKDPLAPED